jgi:hypothetical protein
MIGAGGLKFKTGCPFQKSGFWVLIKAEQVLKVRPIQLRRNRKTATTGQSTKGDF